MQHIKKLLKLLVVVLTLALICFSVSAQDSHTLPGDECIWEGTLDELTRTAGTFGVSVQLFQQPEQEDENSDGGMEYTMLIWSIDTAIPLISAIDQSEVSMTCEAHRQYIKLLDDYADTAVEVTGSGEPIFVGEEEVFLIAGTSLEITRCNGRVETWGVDRVGPNGSNAYPGVKNAWVLVHIDEPSDWRALLRGYSPPVNWRQENTGEVAYVWALTCEESE